MKCHDEKIERTQEQFETKPGHGHKGHGLMMILCMVPLIFITFYRSGDWQSSNNPWNYLFLLLCPLMHVFMMFNIKKHHSKKPSSSYKEEME